MDLIIDKQNGVSIVLLRECIWLRRMSCDEIAHKIYYNNLEIVDRMERKTVATVCPQVAATYRKLAVEQFAYLTDAIEDAERAHQAIQDEDPGCWRDEENSESFDRCTAKYRHRLAQSNDSLEQAKERLKQARKVNRKHSKVARGSKVARANQGGWWSAVYDIWDEPIGPEEEGLFYECGRLKKTRWHATREAAERLVELLQSRVGIEKHYVTGFRITKSTPSEYYPE